MSIQLKLSEISEKDRTKIATDLMIKPYAPISAMSKRITEPSFPFLKYNVEEDWIKIPIAYYRSLNINATPKESKAEPLRDDMPECSIILRADQPIFYNKTVSHLEKTGGAILGVPPGAGKTIHGTKMAHEVGFKWAVIVPRKTLITQWIATYAKCFTGGNISEAKKRIYVPAGKRPNEKLQEKEDAKALSGDYDCIISMEKRVIRLPQAARDKIGFVIIDEGHMLATKTRVDSLLAFTPQFVLIETATLERDDKKDKMMNLLAGNKVFSPKIITPELHGAIPLRKYNVVIFKTGVSFPERISDHTGMLDYTDLVRSVAESASTNSDIVKIIATLVKEFSRKFIVLGKLAKHSSDLCNATNSSGEGITAGVFIRNQEKYVEGDVLFATMPKAGTGFDESTFCPDFSGKNSDAMILTNTVKKWQSFEQFRGRIMRAPLDITPIVIIMVPSNKIFTRHITALKSHIKETKGIITIANSIDCLRNLLRSQLPPKN